MVNLSCAVASCGGGAAVVASCGGGRGLPVVIWCEIFGRWCCWWIRRRRHSEGGGGTVVMCGWVSLFCVHPGVVWFLDVEIGMFVVVGVVT